MSEGYLFRAVGQDNYFEMTVCLAASIRFHGDDRPISVFTDNPKHPLFVKYAKLFDQLIDLRPHVERLKATFNREFKTGFELGGLAPRLLCARSPYTKTISIDSDCMVVNSTLPLWKVFEDTGLAFLGCRRAYPGWGDMTAEEMTTAEIQIEDDLRADGFDTHVSLREVHGGIMWWDNSEFARMVLRQFDDAVKRGNLAKYFPKPVQMWYGHLSDELVYSYVLSVLDHSVIPYNSNLMGSNPDYFSVEHSNASMGHFLTNPRLKGHMHFEETVPVFVHFFAKDKDSNYTRNRDFLIDWLSKGALK